jgi:hypothetical protein
MYLFYPLKLKNVDDFIFKSCLHFLAIVLSNYQESLGGKYIFDHFSDIVNYMNNINVSINYPFTHLD